MTRRQPVPPGAFSGRGGVVRGGSREPPHPHPQAVPDWLFVDFLQQQMGWQACPPPQTCPPSALALTFPGPEAGTHNSHAPTPAPSRPRPVPPGPPASTFPERDTTPDFGGAAARYPSPGKRNNCPKWKRRPRTQASPPPAPPLRPSEGPCAPPGNRGWGRRQKPLPTSQPEHLSFHPLS